VAFRTIHPDNRFGLFNNLNVLIHAMNDLDIRDLRYFEAIAATNHLGMASGLVFRSQPALTNCIKRLETALGVELVERVGRGITITPAGRILADRARGLRASIEEIVREIGDIESGKAGLIRLGVLPTLAKFLLPPLFRALIEESPHVQIQTTIAQNDVLGSLLRDRSVDLILTIANQETGDYISKAVLEDEAVVIASRDHPIFKTKRITVETLTQYPWVLAPPAVGTRKWIDNVFRARNLAGPKVQIETNQILMMPNLICETNLLAFTSRLHINDPDGGSELREVKLPETTMLRRFNLVYRRESYLPPVAHRLIEIISKQGPKLMDKSLML
jgi:DNA-binding transcriptional LysR family regulator